ncbi:fumarylacetoacetase [Endozoicomonas numazuensis]|uniref:fumarylacetoacetase n=1 Tax=Endozoicomonas numazuensis TaxID=1137799 RepID=A0A081NCM3_9GAMM|nr:fumarylacetoacetase [Endozoicomonas numazuensis]KEQ16196.1 fumarylacetoacetase [Endozoicomonas numazuensis]
MISLNETHDVNHTSWVSCANQPDSDFPIQNLPFAVFRVAGESFRCGVAIGNQILDLKAAAAHKPFEGKAADALTACEHENLNPMMELGFEYWSALRLSLSRALRTGSTLESQFKPCLVPMAKAEFALPCQIRDYTDFYSSIYHATAVGSLFRPDNPLLPNYKWVPIGYHGRASSIDVSGQTFHRPAGQTKAPDADQPSYGPCKRLDYELEMGVFIGQGNPMGNRIPLDQTDQHVFGMCLLNDWSARDVQAWEYQPLGPFLAKSFASTISPWIVTLEALAPYRTGYLRPAEDPQPLPYLSSEQNSTLGALDIQLEVLLQTPGMKGSQTPVAQKQCMEKLSQSSFKHSYWTIGQMVAHHASNGCNLQSGDLLGTGTQSGPKPEEAGSLLELTKGGKQPLTLTNGEQRTFLQDGDTVVMRGWCEKEGAARIGFGDVSATILPAKG